MASGGAKCWGENSESQLGDGTTTNRLTPVDVSAFTPYDLSILKTGSPDPVAAYAALTYTLTVSDAGPSAATNVVVTDTLPASVGFVSATPSQGSCSGTATVSCDLGTMNAASIATVTIVVTPTAPGTLDNTATVSATEPDPSPANNSAATTTTVNPQQKTRYVSLADVGFSPASLLGVAQGTTVQWNILGPSANGVADATGMGLFSSGELTPVDYYRFTFTSAGKYAVADLLGHAMTVKVPEKVSPASGGTATTFTLTWSSAAAPSGYAFDIRIRRPGGSWARWLTGQTGMSASFVPDAGTGTYKFRARMRNRGNQAVSGWSAVKSITVA